MLVGPASMAHSSMLVGVHTDVPDLGRFHLRCFEAVEAGGRETDQALHTNGFHTVVFFFFAMKAGRDRMVAKPGGVAFILPPRKGWVVPRRLIKWLVVLSIVQLYWASIGGDVRECSR
jgi:hypothetical protein